MTTAGKSSSVRPEDSIIARPAGVSASNHRWIRRCRAAYVRSASAAADLAPPTISTAMAAALRCSSSRRAISALNTMSDSSTSLAMSCRRRSGDTR
jgi:hypothetical protein